MFLCHMNVVTYVCWSRVEWFQWNCTMLMKSGLHRYLICFCFFLLIRNKAIYTKITLVARSDSSGPAFGPSCNFDLKGNFKLVIIFSQSLIIIFLINKPWSRHNTTPVHGSDTVAFHSLLSCYKTHLFSLRIHGVWTSEHWSWTSETPSHIITPTAADNDSLSPQVSNIRLTRLHLISLFSSRTKTWNIQGEL